MAENYFEHCVRQVVAYALGKDVPQDELCTSVREALGHEVCNLVKGVNVSMTDVRTDLRGLIAELRSAARNAQNLGSMAKQPEGDTAALRSLGVVLFQALLKTFNEPSDCTTCELFKAIGDCPVGNNGHKCVAVWSRLAAKAGDTFLKVWSMDEV